MVLQKLSTVTFLGALAYATSFGCAAYPDQIAYVTDEGLMIEFLGDINHPDQASVERWTHQLRELWRDHVEWPGVAGIDVWFTDKETFPCGSVEAFGCAYYSRTVVIGSKDPQNLFLHELSHIIALRVGYGFDSAAHHALFAELGIP